MPSFAKASKDSGSMPDVGEEVSEYFAYDNSFKIEEAGTFLVKNDEGLSRALADLFLELDDLGDSVLDKFPFGLHQLFPLFSRLIEEAGVDLSLFVLQAYLSRKEIHVSISMISHSQNTTTVVSSSIH